jgi:23S rRNA (uracil747-C5)-methyltransferase
MKILCSYFQHQTCTSCSLIETDYEDQIRRKENKVLSSLNFIPQIKLLPTIRSQVTHFRNKAKMIVSGTAQNPIIGLDQNEILSCPIHHEKINEALIFLKEFITLADLAPYNVKEKKGELKGLILYFSPLSQMGYLRFILRSKESLDRIKKHLPTLQEKCPNFQCISINLQPKHMAILEGEEEFILTNKSFINHQIENLHLSLSPQAFVQTNHFISTELYKTAASWVKALNIKNFVEIFCGQGVFSFFCSESVEKAMGFEINKNAVEQANLTANALQKFHLHFFHEDAKNLSIALQKAQPDLLLVNPPRAGLQQSLEVILQNLPPYLIYSSCSIESLSKDLKELQKNYSIIQAQIFDMFPHTEHFEILILLKAL